MSDEVEAGDRLVQVALTADVVRRLRAIANKLLRDRGDAEDLVQHACLTYVKTVRSGVVVREAEAFLVGAVHRAAMSVGRQNRRRAGRMSIGLRDDEQAAAGGSGCAALDYEALLAEVRLAVPSSLRASLDDCLTGKSDLEIAARDGVEESAVRKRRSRLMAAMVDGLLTEVLASGVSQKRLTGTYPVGAADGQPPTPTLIMKLLLIVLLAIPLSLGSALPVLEDPVVTSVEIAKGGTVQTFNGDGTVCKTIKVVNKGTAGTIEIRITYANGSEGPPIEILAGNSLSFVCNVQKVRTKALKENTTVETHVYKN